MSVHLVDDLEELSSFIELSAEREDKAPADAFALDHYEDDEEIKSFLDGKTHGKYTAAIFANPMELFYTFNEPLSSGKEKAHIWQIEVSELLADNYTKLEQLRLLLCTCNGSGKDSFVVAPFAVWFIWTHIRSKCLITSASWQQLQSQTEPYIRTLCQAINDKLERKVFIIKKMCILCVDTGSIIWLFTTDDPGRAEGHHPFSDYEHSKVAIVVNEAKTVPDVIFNALNRCTFSYWIEVSSPGNTRGHFYTSVTKARRYPETFVKGAPEYYCRVVRSLDCAHIPRSKIEFDKLELGESSPTYRSQHLAEFTSLDENVVITLEALNKCLMMAEEEFMVGTHTAGLDLAAGGDENTFYVFRNNVCVGRETFTTSDTTATKALLMDVFFPKYGFTKATARNINADDGGLGKPIIDDMHAAGWKVTRVNNQSRALRTDLYGNRGAELWCNFKRLVEENIVVLPKDDHKLLTQLPARYYSQHKTTGKLILENKREARSKGHGSPDRADAVCLAFAGINISTFLNAKRRIIVAPVANTAKKPVSAQEIARRKEFNMDAIKYARFNKLLQGSKTTGKQAKTPFHIINNIKYGRN